jgi:predicted AAA+ superfamily ATPase
MLSKLFVRPVFAPLLQRILEPRRFLQVLAGPRQTGKTTLARQLLDAFEGPGHYASADEPTLEDRVWIAQQWEVARLRAAEAGAGPGALLVLDEIQKVRGWSETVKRLWDEDAAAGLPLQVLLLGSSPLLVQQGLTESLAGRFEIVPVTHWSYAEMQEAFGWDLERYVFFGGYPGSAALIADYQRWSRYILDALLETTVSRDILLMARVDKPALLRRLFQLCCEYSGQVLSYQKMVGQLQDAGNTTTLAHYLELLAGAGLVTGLPKYAGEAVRRRASSPKLAVLNTALLTSQAGVPLEAAREDRQYWGRLVESAVGAHLINGCRGTAAEVLYWRERGREVAFILKRGRDLVVIEVKSGMRRGVLPGISAFVRNFHPQRSLLVGTGGIGLEEFLQRPPTDWLE